MPRYYFNLYNEETALDPEGVELPDNDAAIEQGIVSARAMAADSVCKGHLILNHRIEIVREDGRTIETIHFRDAVQVEG